MPIPLHADDVGFVQIMAAARNALKEANARYVEACRRSGRHVSPDDGLMEAKDVESVASRAVHIRLDRLLTQDIERAYPLWSALHSKAQSSKGWFWFQKTVAAVIAANAAGGALRFTAGPFADIDPQDIPVMRMR